MSYAKSAGSAYYDLWAAPAFSGGGLSVVAQGLGTVQVLSTQGATAAAAAATATAVAATAGGTGVALASASVLSLVGTFIVVSARVALLSTIFSAIIGSVFVVVPRGEPLPGYVYPGPFPVPPLNNVPPPLLGQLTSPPPSLGQVSIPPTMVPAPSPSPSPAPVPVPVPVPGSIVPPGC